VGGSQTRNTIAGLFSYEYEDKESNTGLLSPKRTSVAILVPPNYFFVLSIDVCSFLCLYFLVRPTSRVILAWESLTLP